MGEKEAAQACCEAEPAAAKLGHEGADDDDGVELVEDFYPLEVAYAHEGKSLLQKASTHATQSVDWLKKALGTVTGTQKVYEWLQARVEDESFLRCLEENQDKDASLKERLLAGEDDAVKRVERDAMARRASGEAEEDEKDTRVKGSEEAEGLSEGWELVEKEEVLDAMAMFIAAYIQAHPQASKLRPQELQKALSLAFKELRKSKVVLLWQWGSTIWRIGAMSYGAFTVYTNPWLVRTLLQATWCCSRLVIGATATAVGLI
mmetsp:Transcript_13898/g.34969  ORF Transcript_13898/g.34969 Transcript_13898/m.34969 type:complete len:262 (+) Transcript_13898:112-897(+)